MSTAIIYQADVITISETKSYIGQSGGAFKTRYYNHTKSFNHHKYANDTALSKFIWQLKQQNTPYTIKWKIIKQSNTHKRSSGQCNLCIFEKLLILNSLNHNLLNKRSEYISTCRHGKT